MYSKVRVASKSGANIESEPNRTNMGVEMSSKKNQIPDAKHNEHENEKLRVKWASA